MFSSKIAKILCVKVEKIEYNSGIYRIHEDLCEDLCIDKNKLDKILSIDNDIKICFWCNVEFKECFFKEEIFKKNILFTGFYNTLFFKCQFKSCIPNKLKNIKFNSCSFENIDNFLEFASDNTFKECVYESDFVYKDKSLPRIEIKNWTFKGKVELKNITCNKEISFENINFDGKINFSKSTFEKKASFKKCNFNNFFDFSEIDFKDNVYFDDSYFDKFSAFRLCVFEKTASFYSTKFKVIPNFSLGDFKGILNINNATWGENGNIEFEDVENIVVKACGKSETEKEKLETEKELQTIRDIKDSFRTIKNILIKENNQLEAQKFHKAELYCKELELEKEKKNFSTIVDRLLLGFYRITSDHHTNFLKILNFTVFCIAVYAVCNFVFVNIYTATFFGESIIFSKNTSEGIFSWLSAGLFFLAIIIFFLVLKDCELKTFLIYFGLFFAIVVVAVFVNYFYPTIAKILLLFGTIAFLLLSTIIIEKELRLFSLSYLCFCAIPELSSIVYFLADKNKNYDLLFKITIPAIISTYFCLIIFFSYLLEEIDLRKIKDKNLILPVFKCLIRVFKYLFWFFKYLAWVIVAFVLYLYPQLINPFVGVFKSDEILPTNYFEKKLNDLNASKIIEISNLLKNSTNFNLTKVHKEIIDSNTTTNAEIINAKELIKQNLKEINIADNELNTTINNLKKAKDYQEYLVNGIKSSLLVYSIILLLCFYSLTKTARKNSIVPT
ncbi:MAG: pentapeptide repeat-containing protein [Campylobacter sp.]|uniref:pentapeptide repeat-containing protein n=1 Tax=Campylobacter sp. TaxID=205 RepID=UPI002AA721C6|nr:pentapeptide repeat-containing protein [Campylobacter sp.]MCI7501467.1 pentapeptide repeat-containing protein [Campylobacter sp.]